MFFTTNEQMNNKLLDVSINTMIGNLPGIMNYNNDMIEQEFATMFTYIPNGQTYLTIDVSNNTVRSQSGYFRNVTIGGKTLDGGTVEQLTNLNSSVGQLAVDLNELESTVNTIITQIHPYVNSSTRDQTYSRPAARVYESGRPQT